MVGDELRQRGHQQGWAPNQEAEDEERCDAKGELDAERLRCTRCPVRFLQPGPATLGEVGHRFHAVELERIHELKRGLVAGPFEYAADLREEGGVVEEDESVMVGLGGRDSQR